MSTVPQLPIATSPCPDCCAPTGMRHGLSCPEVSPELAIAHINALHPDGPPLALDREESAP